MADDFSTESSTAVIERPQPVTVIPAAEQDPWTADTSVSEANDTQLPTQEGADSDARRNPDGTFAGKSRSKRHDPTTAVRAAKAETKAAKSEAEQARDRIAALEAENAQLRAPKAAATETRPVAETRPAAQPESTRPKPKLEEFVGKADIEDPYAAHLEAVTDWKLEQREIQRATAETQRQVQVRQQTEMATARERLAQMPDRDATLQAFDATLVKSGFKDAAGVAACPPALMAALVTSEHISAIVQFLGSHPEDLAQWAADAKGLPVTAGSQVRRLLERAVIAAEPQAAGSPDAAPKVKASTASAPINRVGGTAQASAVDPDDLAFGPEYMKAENARERAVRKAGRW